MACIITVSTCRRELLIMCDAPPRPRCRQCGDHLQPAPCLLSPHTSIVSSIHTVVTVEVVRGRQIATVTTAPSSCAGHTTRAPAFHLQTDRWYTGLEKNRLNCNIVSIVCAHVTAIVFLLYYFRYKHQGCGYSKFHISRGLRSGAGCMSQCFSSSSCAPVRQEQHCCC